MSSTRIVIAVATLLVAACSTETPYASQPGDDGRTAATPKDDPAPGTESPGAPAQPSTAPELPCPEAERTTFRAHAGGSDAPFEVPEDAGNLAVCFTYSAPWPSGTQATAFAPLIDTARDWILYETATPQPENGVGRCNVPVDATLLQGWARGSDGIPLPPDVGLRLPEKGKWLILQVHYWNAAPRKEWRDGSGVVMCTTATPRPHTAAISMLGTAAINLPPRSRDVAITGTCTPLTDEPLHVIASGPHMHQLGKSLTTEILRGGSEGTRTPVVDVPRWNFELQQSYATDVVVNPGDKLVTTCRYDNPSDRRVTLGERTEDEMCFNFLVVWPAPGLTNAGNAGGGCIDP